MNGLVANTRWLRRRLLVVLSLAVVVPVLAWLPSSASAGSGPGTWSQSDINGAVANGIGYFDANQNSNGSWGTTAPSAETSLALASYGVLDSGHYANLSPAQQTRVNNGLAYLLGTQGSSGAFSGDGYPTYDTGLALTALSLNTDNPTYANQISTAIANARTFLIGEQNITGHGGLNCSGPSASSGDYYCGGWDYSGPDARSDESNTGFALTGLDLTGGVPSSVATPNVNWQRAVQNLYASGTNNSAGFPSRNDGGGSYTPGFVGSNSGVEYVSSNANDSGSLLFGLGYDGVPGNDPAAAAAIKFGNDVIDTYELNKATREMIYHTGTNEDGSCQIGSSNCDWQFAPTYEGGYHYSIFALVKGLSQYSTPDPNDPNNFYAKSVDLLLSQQQPDGSWPVDGRDDASTLASTGFAILALGKVGAPVQPISASGRSLNATEGQPFNGPVANVSDPNSGSSASQFSATIHWGDGSSTAGTVTGSSGSYTVNGQHTYAEEGSYTVTVDVTRTYQASNGSSGTESANASSSMKTADAPLHATGTSPARTGGAVKNGRVATFTDSDPQGTLSDYSATINWGDGHTSSGTVKAASGKYAVTGTHTYKKTGRFTIRTTIRDAGGSTTTATVTITVAELRGVRASASLVAAPACVSSSFNAELRGSQIASVRFTLDGHPVASRAVHRGSLYSARVSISSGSHTLAVRVKFRAATHTQARTFHTTVVGCAPRFTG